MDLILVVLNALVIIGIGCVFLFRKYLFSYSVEKGRNLATKEDIEEITRKVEEVKSEYVVEIEKLKVDLSVLSRKHSMLLDEKIRVFKKLQKRLVEFKKYCEAALGSYDGRGDFHPSLDSLSQDIDRACLQHLSALYEIEQEDFIFLSKKSRKLLAELHDNCSMMCSIELAIFGLTNDSEMVKSAVPIYESAINNIDRCLQSLYEELEFPSIEK